MAARKTTNYLNNENLITEIILSKKKQQEKPNLTPSECMTHNLVLMLKKLVDRYAVKHNWRSYSFNEDMRCEALISLCQNGLKFDETKYNNPFAYYTQIIHHSFLSHLDKEARLRDIRDELLIMQGDDPSMHRQMENEKNAEILSQTMKDQKDRAIELNQLVEQVENIGNILQALKTDYDGVEVDALISVAFSKEAHPYTSGYPTDELLPKNFNYSVTPDSHIGDTYGTVVRIASNDGSFSNSRILVNPHTGQQVINALISLCLIAHKDIITKEIQKIRGQNQASLRHIKIVNRTNSEEDNTDWDNQALRYNNPPLERKPRGKPKKAKTT